MKRFLLAISLLCAVPVLAQNGAINLYCVQGATNAVTSNLPSSNKLQGVIPKCTVTVYYTGTGSKAPIFTDAGGDVLGNPFTANTDGSFIFYTSQNQGVDVVLSGGTPPLTYASPKTFTDMVAAANSTSGFALNVNGTPLALPTPGNIQNSPTITVSNPSNGNIQLATIPFQVNATPIASTGPPDVVDSSTVTFTNPTGTHVAAAAVPLQVNGGAIASTGPPDLVDGSNIQFTNPTGTHVTANASNIANAALQHSSVTVNNQNCPLGGSCTAISPPVTPVHIAESGCNGSTTGTISLATLVLTCPTNTKGDTLTLAVYSNQSLNAFNSVNFGVTDSQGNAWILIKNDLGRGFSTSAALYIATGIAGGSDTVTITETVSNGAAPIGMLYGGLDEFSGVNPSFPIMQAALQVGNGGSSSAGFSLPATQSADLLYEVSMLAGNVTPETFSATGYTALPTVCPVQSGNFMCAGTLYAISNASTTSLWAPTVGWTTPSSSFAESFFMELTGGTNSNPIVQNVVITNNTPTVNQAACIKSAGPPVVIGYCSTVVSSGGACTCN